jgi:hypothetical protein
MKAKQIDMFHNTINLLPSERAGREVKASNQNDKILEFFKQHPFNDFTAAEIWIKFGQQWPLTSVRRAISTLAKMDLLLKTDKKRVGIYNELNFTWKLKQ